MRPLTFLVASVWPLLLVASPGGAEPADPLDPQPGIRTPLERVVEEPLPRTVCEGCLVFALSHRPHLEAFADPIRDLFGYDGGFVRVRLDLRVGILPWLDAGATRTNGILLERYDAWSADLRAAHRFARPDGSGSDLGLQAGTTWFEQEDAPDALAAWGWVGAGTSAGPVWLGGGLEWHSNSSSPDKRDSDPDATWGLHAEAIVRLRQNLSVAAEIARPVSGYGHRIPSWTLGPRWNTWRHVFSVWLGNGRGGGPDGRVTGASRWGSPVLGFQIVREATLWNTGKSP